MLPGPDKIVACPNCQGLARHTTLMSGNTIGARTWTDGKQIAEDMPEPPAVVKCRHCKVCYWLAGAKEIGCAGWGRRAPDHPEWEAAEHVEEPSEAEYYKAIDKGLATDRKQERELRILAWWRSNVAFREEPGAPPKRRAKRKAEDSTSSSQGRTKNLEALVGLLAGRKIENRVMKAEVLRQLGKFEAAKQLLSGVTSRDWRRLVQQLQSLCDSHDTCVRVMDFGG